MSIRQSAIAAAGNRLVAADDEDEPVEAVTAGHQLDRVGDDLAGDERRLHPLRAHGHTVAHRDGVELHRRAARGTHAFLDLLGERTVIPVARHGLDPGVADADDRSFEILAAEADGAEHRARGRAIGTVQHHRAPAVSTLFQACAEAYGAATVTAPCLTGATSRPYPSRRDVVRLRAGPAGRPAPD